MNMMKMWMRQASPEEQTALAQGAGTSRGHLYQVSNGNRKFAPGKAALIKLIEHRVHAGKQARLMIEIRLVER